MPVHVSCLVLVLSTISLIWCLSFTFLEVLVIFWISALFWFYETQISFFDFVTYIFTLILESFNDQNLLMWSESNFSFLVLVIILDPFQKLVQVCEYNLLYYSLGFIFSHYFLTFTFGSIIHWEFIFCDAVFVMHVKMRWKWSLYFFTSLPNW